MKERPILFNADMVRAILDERKTQTRRVVKEYTALALDAGVSINPSWEVGDLLWVRETFCMFQNGNDKRGIAYRADTEDGWYSPCETLSGGYPAHCLSSPGCNGCTAHKWKPIWRPSVHMPRWASRITLEITEVRVRRLQDISEQDAVAEGMMMNSTEKHWCGAPHKAHGFPRQHNTAIEAFADLWNSIYGTWDENPWVWAISFKRIEA